MQFLASKFPGKTEQEYRQHLGNFQISGMTGLQQIGTLSGGQKSRVAFAPKFASRPFIPTRPGRAPPAISRCAEALHGNPMHTIHGSRSQSQYIQFNIHSSKHYTKVHDNQAKQAEI